VDPPQAALVFGFFQMAGFNRYSVDATRGGILGKAHSALEAAQGLVRRGGKQQELDFLDVLQRLDAGWAPKEGAKVCFSPLFRPFVSTPPRPPSPERQKHLCEAIK